MKGYIFFFFLKTLIVVSCSDNYIPKNTKVSFLSNRDSPKGEFDIFITDINTSEKINLTKNIKFITSVSNPILSQDNKTVLYTSFNKNQKFLCAIDVETKINTNVSELNLSIPGADFFDSGDKLIFVKKVNGVKQIFTSFKDGSNQKNISSTKENEYGPIISLDNKKLAYIRTKKNKSSIVLRDLKNQEEYHFDVKGNSINPSFTNDNNIVYESFLNGSYKIFIFYQKSKKIEQITTGDSNANYPFSVLNDKSILFVTDGRGKKYKDLCLLNLETKKYEILTDKLNMLNHNARVSRDRETVVFESSKFNDSEIYMLNLIDKSVINLSQNKAWDCRPSF